MDTVGVEAKIAAERQARQAAMDAKAAYYHNPQHHPSSYMPEERVPYVPEMGPAGAMNAPYAPNGMPAGGTGGQMMQPYLQLMVGPLLNYYTTVNNVWIGAVMVVTVDRGSQLQQPPILSIASYPWVPVDDPQNGQLQPISQPNQVPAQHMFTYNDNKEGPCSFWRFMIQVPLQQMEQTVTYSINNGAPLRFCVAAIGQNFVWAAHSCNGFSLGVDVDDFKGKTDSGYDPVWEDLLAKHTRRPFHCMVGGGDQIYCDAITREPELQSWINAPDKQAKIRHIITEEMHSAVDRFYFNHYCKMFREHAFGRANAIIPMVNMLDDHDIIDGFGTYDDETMASPVMSYIGSRGYFWFLLFQLFTVDEVDGTSQPFGQHPIPSMLIGGPGAWIPNPGHSLSVYLGPQVHMILLDCRAERKLRQICSPETYRRVFAVIQALPAEVQQLIMQLGVPIAYPRMSFLEHFLSAKFNPLTFFARHNMFGLGGMVNKFDHTAELLDDLNDHWCANVHKKERNWLVLELQALALKCKVRVTFLSGDVHLAACGLLFSYYRRKSHKLAPPMDHRYMLNVVTSAIVNTPPPAGAAMMVSILSGHKHRTLHRHRTDEVMLPLFEKDTDGTTQQKPFVLARRNYAAVAFNNETGNLTFDIRVEKKPGEVETISYPVDAPPPRW